MFEMQDFCSCWLGGLNSDAGFKEHHKMEFEEIALGRGRSGIFAFIFTGIQNIDESGDWDFQDAGIHGRCFIKGEVLMGLVRQLLASGIVLLTFKNMYLFVAKILQVCLCVVLVHQIKSQCDVCFIPTRCLKGGSQIEWLI